jgi:sigma-B regulation protein RsbU (phosphoserine phosphatase)
VISPHRAWHAYSVAIAAAALALALTSVTVRPLGGAYLYFPLIAVFVSALHGGLGPGTVTVVICTLGFDFLYLGPPYRLGVATVDEAHRLAGFVLFGGAATWIAANFRASRHEAEEARRTAEAASEDARRIGAQQERLVAVVGHDLRNPLAALAGNLGILGRLGPLTERQARVVASMRQTVARMEGMIRDLLDVARTRQGELVAVVPEDVRVGDLCERVLAEARAAHPEALLSLSVEGNDRAHLDAGRVAQAVSNLVANALQHGAPGAPVHVRVAQVDGDVKIEVESTGAPIPASLRSTLFEPFRRGPTGGVGLGLFVVREIARAHGGGATFRSDAAATVFEVRLPREGARRTRESSTR